MAVTDGSGLIPVAELREKCICKKLGIARLMMRWRIRMEKVMRRMVSKGHRLDARRLSATTELLVAVSIGRAAAFSKENWHKSHHSPECPCSPRKNPRSTVVFD